MREQHPLRRIEEIFFDRRASQPSRENGLFTHFYTANEYTSLAEVLPHLSSPQQENVVSILVGESDFLSAIHKIPGDIIFCDIDRTLLSFIKEQVEFLQSIYNGYYAPGHLPFKGVVNIYDHRMKNLFNYDFLKHQIDRLGGMHFFANEERYKRAMTALSAKRIIVADIDLFRKEEQNLLCKLLVQSQVKVKVFNATNLPDYDGTNALSGLFSNLPWTEDALIAWTIHDRGPIHSELDVNIHYSFLFTPNQFLEFNRPEFLADVDRMNLPDTMCRPDFLRRYAEFNQYIQDSVNPVYRERYLKRMKKNVHSDITPQNIQRHYGMCNMPRHLPAIYFITRLEGGMLLMRHKAEGISPALSEDIQIYANKWLEIMCRYELIFFQQQLHLKREMIEDAMLQCFQTPVELHKQFWREVACVFLGINITVQPVCFSMGKHHYFFNPLKRKELTEAGLAQNSSAALRNDFS